MNSHQRGYLGILVLLITAAIAAFVFLKYYDKNPETGKSAAQTNIEGIDAAKQIQIQAQSRADETNAMMR
jgi:hypothetical protein